MKKLFDLRLVIGLFFAVVGALLAVYYFTAPVAAGFSASVNIWCGTLFLLFGVGMILLSRGKGGGEE